MSNILNKIIDRILFFIYLIAKYSKIICCFIIVLFLFTIVTSIVYSILIFKMVMSVFIILIIILYIIYSLLKNKN